MTLIDGNIKKGRGIGFWGQLKQESEIKEPKKKSLSHAKVESVESSSKASANLQGVSTALTENDKGINLFKASLIYVLFLALVIFCIVKTDYHQGNGNEYKNVSSSQHQYSNILIKQLPSVDEWLTPSYMSRHDVFNESEVKNFDNCLKAFENSETNKVLRMNKCSFAVGYNSATTDFMSANQTIFQPNNDDFQKINSQFSPSFALLTKNLGVNMEFKTAISRCDELPYTEEGYHDCLTKNDMRFLERKDAMLLASG